MASNAAWAAKYRDGRWQRLAARLKEERGWKCQGCGVDDPSEQLAVHHAYYHKGLDPWEYEECSLWVLCEACHQEYEDLRQDLIRAIGLLTLEEASQFMWRVLEPYVSERAGTIKDVREKYPRPTEDD